MSLVILFGQTNQGVDRRKFVKAKLESFFGSEGDQDQNVEVVCKTDPAEIKLLERDHFPTFSEETWAKIRDTEACFIKEVNAKWHPEEGEKIIEDLITYSISFSSSIKAGTPVLRRTTNMGIVYFAKPNLAFSRESAIKRSNLSVGVGIVSITTDILLAFAKGIASATGSTLVEKIFGCGNSIDTKQLCKELAEIVKDANTEQTVQEQSGQINSVQNNLTVFYKNEKEINPNDRKLLSSELRNLRNDHLDPALNILKEENFKRKGISVFITGANLMLALLQEMALVDPNEPDYKKSASYQSYKDVLAQYIQYVEDIRKLITNERLDQVTKISCKDECHYVPPGEVICVYHCRYDDKFTGKNYDFTNDDSKDDNPKTANEKANESRSKLIKDLEAELKWMDDIVKEWKNTLAKA